MSARDDELLDGQLLQQLEQLVKRQPTDFARRGDRDDVVPPLERSAKDRLPTPPCDVTNGCSHNVSGAQ